MKKKKEKISLEKVAILVDSLAEITKEGFDGVGNRLDKVDEQLEKVDGRLEKVEGRMERMENRFTSLEENQLDFKLRLDAFNYHHEMTEIKKRIVILERKVGAV